MSTVDEARGRWPWILESVGFPPESLRNVHGPCPLGCNGRKSWRFDDQLNGRWICTHCGSGDGFAAMQKKMNITFKESAKMVEDLLGTGNAPAPGVAKEGPSDEEKRAVCTEWGQNAARIVEGDLVWRYLRSRCGDISIDQLKYIRHHKAMKHTEDGNMHNVMLAIMLGEDGKWTGGIHRTWLTPDAQKTSLYPARKSYGKKGVIRLGEAAEVMGIAEGIETALAASQIFKIPVWSAVDANGLEAFNPPPCVKTLVICGDCDAKFTGQSAAYSLANRLAISDVGLEIEVRIPQDVGTDWADCIAPA